LITSPRRTRHFNAPAFVVIAHYVPAAKKCSGQLRDRETTTPFIAMLRDEVMSKLKRRLKIKQLWGAAPLTTESLTTWQV